MDQHPYDGSTVSEMPSGDGEEESAFVPGWHASVRRRGSPLGTFVTMSLTTIVAQNILATRKQKNLSQVAIAKKAKVSVSYVSMLERGVRKPTLDTLEALAKALGVPPLALLQGRPARR